MISIRNEIAERLCRSGLVNPGESLLGVDSEWNRNDPDSHILAPLFERLAAGAILFARPAEPYRSAIDYLASRADGRIYPRDSETRMFLYDLPVAETFSTETIAETLIDRKSAIITGRGIVTRGATPEQAQVTYSSVCFAGFVKFFSDYLAGVKSGLLDPNFRAAFKQACRHLNPPPHFRGGLLSGPFETEDTACAAMVEAGKKVVDLKLVDSNFGNISCLVDDVLHISRTGSFLDDLSDAIVPCRLDGPPSTRANASSELPAHLRIIRETGMRAVLHGHPLFSVIMSMDCGIKGCDRRGECHRFCPFPREIGGTPIVSGETGGGEYGLCGTVPDMIRKKGGTIVYGHGVFTGGAVDFNEPMARMVEIERRCREEYFTLMDRLTD